MQTRRDMRFFRVVLTGAAFLWPIPHSAHADVLRTEIQIGSDTALAAASVALKACEKRGFKVSVAVVDPSGELKAFLRGDGAAPHTVEVSFRKAFSANTYRAPTSVLNPIFGKDPMAASVPHQRNVTTIPGGVPIVVRGSVIGAIGVSGARPTPPVIPDEECAQAGIDHIRAAIGPEK